MVRRGSPECIYLFISLLFVNFHENKAILLLTNLSYLTDNVSRKGVDPLVNPFFSSFEIQSAEYLATTRYTASETF
jgi:hypothetical protein